MANFIINRGANNERAVLADDYKLIGEYFYFTRSGDDKVFTISSSHVATIEMEQA